jgi:hypothetical protein
MQAFYTYNSLGSHLYEQVYLEMKKAFKEEKLKYQKRSNWEIPNKPNRLIVSTAFSDVGLPYISNRL